MKISGIVVLAFCLMVSAIILAVGYSNYDPTMKEVASWKTYRDGLIQESKNAPKAIQREKDAKKAQEAVNTWNAIAATRTLPDSLAQGGIDLSMNEYQLAIVVPTSEIASRRWLTTRFKAGGVKVITGPSIPLAPTDPTKILLSYFNYPALPPVVIFDLGTVTVQGTYQQISDNIKAWSRMPHFLAVADGLRLTGTSPQLTGTYLVSIVGFLQTDPTRPIFPPVPPGGKLVTTSDTTTPAAGATPGGARPKGAAPAAGAPAGTRPAPGTPGTRPVAGTAGAARVPGRAKTP